MWARRRAAPFVRWFDRGECPQRRDADDDRRLGNSFELRGGLGCCSRAEGSSSWSAAQFTTEWEVGVRAVELQRCQRAQVRMCRGGGGDGSPVQGD
ncbi:hypothetical protein K466DRAFT_140791 [Polyporus arcularius HHB13444]|uniref:Uncharacterized protein n=1 Tax=Polyporus arcularius HHB13444 TaxID=1314778 RepID=A0A5C3NKN0_9APHY|nr:hypothetical protein K466DRAFT_140791 [Polyporus arcularius HHB13444]